MSALPKTRRRNSSGKTHKNELQQLRRNLRLTNQALNTNRREAAVTVLRALVTFIRSVFRAKADAGLTSTLLALLSALADLNDGRVVSMLAPVKVNTMVMLAAAVMVLAVSGAASTSRRTVADYAAIKNGAVQKRAPLMEERNSDTPLRFEEAELHPGHSLAYDSNTRQLIREIAGGGAPTVPRALLTQTPVL